MNLFLMHDEKSKNNLMHDEKSKNNLINEINFDA